MPAPTARSAPTTTSGIANLCQRDAGGLRRRLRVRVAIGESIVERGRCRPDWQGGRAIPLAERIGSRPSQSKAAFVGEGGEL